MDDPRNYLSQIAALPDADIDLARAAVALAAVHTKDNSVIRFELFLDNLSERMRALSSVADVHEQHAALRQVLCDELELAGDEKSFHDVRNALLTSVIDRRLGLPVAIAIIALHASRAAGWQASGLNFPGHFLFRLDSGAHRIVCDPFDRFRVMEAPDLRQLLKRTLGEKAELSAAYFEAAENREILMRLHNNIKIRLIDADDYAGALKTVEEMLLFAPMEERLYFDAGVLHARMDEPNAAIEALENYRKFTKAPENRQQAAMLIQALQRLIN